MSNATEKPAPDQAPQTPSGQDNDQNPRELLAKAVAQLNENSVKQSRLFASRLVFEQAPDTNPDDSKTD